MSIQINFIRTRIIRDINLRKLEFLQKLKSFYIGHALVKVLGSELMSRGLVIFFCISFM